MNKAQQIWLRDFGLSPVPECFHVSKPASKIKNLMHTVAGYNVTSKEQRSQIRAAVVVALKSGKQYYQEIQDELVSKGIISAKENTNNLPFVSRTTLLRVAKEERDRLGIVFEFGSTKVIKMFDSGLSRKEIVSLHGLTDEYVFDVLKKHGRIKPKYNKAVKNGKFKSV